MRKSRYVHLVMVAVLLALLLPGAASAAPPAQEGQSYTVQADDYLWALAEKYLGNGAAYIAIVAATNEKHEEDGTFARIDSPSLIQPGWKLFIPGAEEAEAYMARFTPVRGGTLRIGVGTDAGILGYPAKIVSSWDQLLTVPAIERLARRDPSGQVVPWLATGWQTDPDAKTVTVTLRKGVKFHDGTDFNAEAAKWNLDQFLASGRPEVRNLESVEVLDDYTIRVNLKDWVNTAVDDITYWAGRVASPTAYKTHGEEWALNNPVGTGPFKFVSWERDVSLKYERFGDYWQAGQPYLDGVEWVIIADPMSALAAFKAGEIDVFTEVQPEAMEDLKASGYTVLVHTSGLGGRILGVAGSSVNPDSPFADVRVRRAVGHAVDAQTIVDTVMRGAAVRTNQWAPPGNWTYNADVKGYPYDPQKAKALLAEAGYPDGFATTLSVGGAPIYQQEVAPAVQGYLAAVGIDAEVDPMDMGRYRQVVLETGWGEGMVIFSAQGSDFDVNGRRAHHSKGNIWTKSIIHPPEIDSLLDELLLVRDFETKKAMVHESQRLIFDEYAIWSPMFLESAIAVTQPEVHGTGIYGTMMIDWTPEDAWIEQ